MRSAATLLVLLAACATSHAPAPSRAIATRPVTAPAPVAAVDTRVVTLAPAGTHGFSGHAP